MKESIIHQYTAQNRLNLLDSAEHGRLADEFLGNPAFKRAYETLENRLLETAINQNDTDCLREIKLLRNLRSELHSLMSEGIYAEHKLEEERNASNKKG